MHISRWLIVAWTWTNILPTHEILHFCIYVIGYLKFQRVDQKRKSIHSSVKRNPPIILHFVTLFREKSLGRVFKSLGVQGGGATEISDGDLHSLCSPPDRFRHRPGHRERLTWVRKRVWGWCWFTASCIKQSSLRTTSIQLFGVYYELDLRNSSMKSPPLNQMIHSERSQMLLFSNFILLLNILFYLFYII